MNDLLSIVALIKYVINLTFQLKFELMISINLYIYATGGKYLNLEEMGKDYC